MEDDDLALQELIHAGYRYALSLSHHREEAEDLLHDAWLAIIRAKGPRHKGYLFRAIRNHWINRVKRARTLKLIPMEGDVPETEHEERAQIGVPADFLEHALLERSLATLRPIEREALYFAAVEGYTAQEISELTQQARGSVLSLIHRARQKIRVYFTHHQGKVER